ncbi:hypothetical protein PM023_16060 [Halorubrum ezzemoulense]|uniref:hypothetical protein n=1 Tax=Halorubrum ezzemoulense TaxID=337243 RepID=UPI00232F2553|nr:hypothetical protein [Halorubrum ezzemoulense]MDB2226161.1 hypothetical protein [Halorubrum ezzemoulense]
MTDFDEGFWPMTDAEFYGVCFLSVFLSAGLNLVALAVHFLHRPLFTWSTSRLTLAAEWAAAFLAVYLVIGLLLLPIQYLSHWFRRVPGIVPQHTGESADLTQN